MSHDDTARAWAYLSRVAEPPCAELVGLVRSVGPVEAAERVRRGEVSPALAEHTVARREMDCAADDLDALQRRGGRLVTPDDDEWPLLAFTAFDGAAIRERQRGGPCCCYIRSLREPTKVRLAGAPGEVVELAALER